MAKRKADEAMLLHPAAIGEIDRGAGVKTTPLVGRWNTRAGRLTTGRTTFGPGTEIPLHTHNVDETVMLLRGVATVNIDGRAHAARAGDVTWIPAGVPHNFRNRGAGEMQIYWVYAGRDVSRTIVATGETFEHLSEADRRLATKPAAGPA